MAKGYASRQKRISRTSSLIAVTLLVIVLFIANIASRGAIAMRVRSASAFVGGLFEDTYAAIAHNGFLSSHSSLAKQNAALQQHVAQLQDELAGTAPLQEENQQLAALTHVAQTEPGVTAAVLSSYSSSPYGTFLISAGQNAAAPDDLVEDSGGFVLGKVVQSGGGTALVSEIFAPNASIDADVNGIAASADGEGGGNARMQVPQGSAVQVGDTITAPSLGQRPIGIVGEVSSDPSDAYMTLYISAPSNIASLGYVYVVHK